VSAASKIEWTDATWNPIRGCTRVSEGCRNCYAERIAAGFSGKGEPYHGLARMTPSGPRWTGDLRLVEEAVFAPLHWRKPRTIFVNSMSDLFHENVPVEWIDRLFWVMRLASHHTFQILTKRPKRMRDLLTAGLAHPGYWRPRLPVPNVWLGVSAEDQPRADERIPLLLETPAAVRFVSAEPLLGPIDLSPYLGQGFRCDVCDLRFRHGSPYPRCPRCEEAAPDPEREAAYATGDPSLGWVIVGGESGPGARPMHPAWVRSIRDQLKCAGVPFFFKQWGEWGPEPRKPFDPDEWEEDRDLVHFDVGDGEWLYRVGKKAAGRRLDGRTWDEFPRR